MNPSNESNGKRGRKPADSWTWKDDAGNEYPVKVTIKSADEYSDETRQRAMDAGLRLIAGQEFRKYMSETVPEITTNIQMRDKLVATFNPTEKQLKSFMKDKPTEIPTEWTFED